MLYVFNGKSLKSEMELSKEISLFVSNRLKTYKLALKGEHQTLNRIYRRFTHRFLKPPKSPNPIKHLNEASNLTIYLNGKYFRGFLSEVNIFNNSEQISVVCYGNKELNKITIEVKHMLVRLRLVGDHVNIRLIEI